MKKLINTSILLGLAIIIGCTSHQTAERKYKDPRESDESMKEAYKLQGKVTNHITVDVETKAVVAKADDDAADDPAIWVNPSNPDSSLVIGTDKKHGLYVYDLQGNEKSFYPVGKVNNVDVRQGIVLGTDTVTIVAASNRSEHTITLMKLDTATMQLQDISTKKLELGTAIDDAYGFCLYHDLKASQLYAYVNGKNGIIQQWKLFAVDSGKIDGKLVRTLKVASQPEGMVADDKMDVLYIGEENKGIWKVTAKPDTTAQMTFIAESEPSENELIVADIEGISLYETSDSTGYLIASSQGNFSYAVFTREGDNKYITSFALKDGKVDGVEETDGLETVSIPLGEKYPKGALVVQDGFNFDGDSLLPQNFKIIDWRKVEAVLEQKAQ